jgi:NhaP-type Na+/H+ or K+/H+ antiporter
MEIHGDFREWLALAGALLLAMALASGHLRQTPISSSAVYLVVGLAVGPLGLGWLRIALERAGPWLERLTELAVVVSLFTGGLKLRLPLRDPAWRPALWLAGPVMLASISGIAAVAHLGLRLPLATAILVAAVLAPTDPVLAGAVTVNDARDCEKVRYALSGEAGFNDGMAFPFVVFALEWARHGGGGAWIGGWALLRLLWAVPAGIVLGLVLGQRIGRLAIRLRHRDRDASGPNGFLTLALIALAYVAAEAVGAWGFLAVFAAGVGLRRAEIRVVTDNPHPDVESGGGEHPPAEHLVAANVDAEALAHPAVAAGALVSDAARSGDVAERLLEVVLVVLVGAAAADHFDVRGLVVALVLFVVLRPLAAVLLLPRGGTTARQRALLGWFGIRGIGSLYYLAYAANHGFDRSAIAEAAALTITVVAASIVVHGITSSPPVMKVLSAEPDEPPGHRAPQGSTTPGRLERRGDSDRA